MENWEVIQAVTAKRFNWLVGSGWSVLLLMSPNSHNPAGPMFRVKKASRGCSLFVPLLLGSYVNISVKSPHRFRELNYSKAGIASFCL